MKKRIAVALFVIITIALVLFWTTLKKETDLPLDSLLVKELDQMTHPSEDAMLLKELYENNTISDSYRIAVGINAYLKKQETKRVSSLKKLACCFIIFAGLSAFTGYKVYDNYSYQYDMDDNSYVSALGLPIDDYGFLDL